MSEYQYLMSEYQYFEFIAIDEPLTPKQMAELRACSTRANITPASFVNDYQRGDLKGDSEEQAYGHED